MKYIVKVCFSTTNNQHPLKSAEEAIKEILANDKILVKPTINVAELDVETILSNKAEKLVKQAIRDTFESIYPETEIVHVKIERAH